MPFRIVCVFLPLLLFSGCGISFPSASQAQKTQIQKSYRITRNLIFTPQGWPERLPADLYQPRKPGLSPAVLLIHGGGWSGGDGRWQMEPIAKQLAKHGYVVMNVTYRQAPQWIFPAPVDDVGEALKWMRIHALEAGIDSDRIASFGYSAGGYLAAMVAYQKNSQVEAVVAGGMPSNLSLYPGENLIPQFLGGRRDEIPEKFREASPVNYISKNSPPTFLYHGGVDRVVPPEQAWETVHALERFSVPYEIYWIQNKGHIRAFLFPDDALNQAIQFLDQFLHHHPRHPNSVGRWGDRGIGSSPYKTSREVDCQE